MSETIVDILREMREEAQEDCYTPDGLHGQSLNYFADRIEAAHKREVGVAKMETTTGNNAKMREALKQIYEVSDHWYYGVDTSKSSEDLLIECGELAEAALAEPQRNSDTKYTYALQWRFREDEEWNLLQLDNSSEEATRHKLDQMKVDYPKAEWRIVRKPKVEWEVAE